MTLKESHITWKTLCEMVEKEAQRANIPLDQIEIDYIDITGWSFDITASIDPDLKSLVVS